MKRDALAAAAVTGVLLAYVVAVAQESPQKTKEPHDPMGYVCRHGCLGRKRFRCDIGVSKIMNAPEWKQTEDHPPLSLRVATHSATESLVALVEHPKRWVIDNIDVVRHDDLHWFYVVWFWARRDKDGKPHEAWSHICRLPFAVLMDGTVVQPTFTKEL